MMRSIGPARNPGMAAYFLNINRGKKSLVLDLKRPAARAAILRLATTADVFVHNMRPGAAARLGIDYAAVAAANPRIVYAWASGYRAGGPYARPRRVRRRDPGRKRPRRAQQGSRTARRAICRWWSCDKLCGHSLASMVGMALYHREKTGEGQEVHVPMMETMVAFNLVDHFWHGVFGEPEKGLGYPRMLTPYRRPYATSDGHVCLLATTDRQWRNLFAALDRPELADDPRYSTIAGRTANIDALYTLVAEILRTADDRRLARPARPVRRAERRRQRPRRPRRRPVSERDRVFRAGRSPDRGADGDDGDRARNSRGRRPSSACRRRGSASTTRNCSPNSATATREIAEITSP